MNIQVVTMYRPCGQKELDLVIQSGYKAWPPRLPDQPIFYPVTNERYAIEVNRWNVSQFGKGYVTKFYVRKDFIEKYKVETVGGRHHTEWWIPAEELTEFNNNIIGLIEIIYEEPSA